MQEKLDVYDENKNKIGKNIVRGKDKLEDGEYTLAAQAIIMNCNNEILISQRSSAKEKAPLKWECNGGATLFSESSLDAVIREIYEELGITLDKKMQFI